MKIMRLMVASAAAGVLLAAPSYLLAEDAQLKDEDSRLSYTIGADMGTNFKEHEDIIKINPQLLLKGIEDAMGKSALKLTKEEMAESIQGFQKKIMSKRQDEFKNKAEANKKKGEKFLEENKAKAGVVTTKSGLQYKEISAGSGTSPDDNDEVEVGYTGRLIDGTVFDTSDKGENKTVTFKVSEVIPGWTEALKLMKPGDKWEVAVPSNLAYGETGVGGPIGPNETLIFDIHLQKVFAASESKGADSTK